MNMIVYRFAYYTTSNSRSNSIVVVSVTDGSTNLLIIGYWNHYVVQIHFIHRLDLCVRKYCVNVVFIISFIIFIAF